MLEELLVAVQGVAAAHAANVSYADEAPADQDGCNQSGLELVLFVLVLSLLSGTGALYAARRPRRSAQEQPQSL